MTRYLTKVIDTLQRLGEWTIKKIPQADNTSPSIIETFTCNTIEGSQEEGQEWTKVIIEYLRTGALPDEPKCLYCSKAQYVLAELHEGVCGNHSKGRSLAHRAHSQGYYWPTMKNDAMAYVKKCDKCQRRAPIPHVPSETLKPISSPWPFAQWGMDTVGPLPIATA
ncbi:hypothetical protein CK203_116507 [Vitis vinifera]|uniref:Integrase zinc-binding domain-containing protein n=1 Tax=Vitis vinifera TaxID=29760 RepID=A0A438C899_VITVI|nr:hypothetical protein CK203_116507 [Vitis vinifera]